DLAILRQDRFRARPVAAVSATAARGIALLVTQGGRQLSAERALDQGLLELFEKPIVPRQVLGLFIVSQQLIQQLRSNREIRRHVSLPSKVNSQKPAYTFFLTPSGFRAHHIEHPDRKGRIERPFAWVERNFLAGRSFSEPPGAQLVPGC